MVAAIHLSSRNAFSSSLSLSVSLPLAIFIVKNHFFVLVHVDDILILTNNNDDIEFFFFSNSVNPLITLIMVLCVSFSAWTSSVALRAFTYINGLTFWNCLHCFGLQSSKPTNTSLPLSYLLSCQIVSFIYPLHFVRSIPPEKSCKLKT